MLSIPTVDHQKAVYFLSIPTVDNQKAVHLLSIPTVDHQKAVQHDQNRRHRPAENPAPENVLPDRLLRRPAFVLAASTRQARTTDRSG